MPRPHTVEHFALWPNIHNLSKFRGAEDRHHKYLGQAVSFRALGTRVHPQYDAAIHSQAATQVNETV